MSNEQHPLDDSIRSALGATADDIDVNLFPPNAIERRGRTRQRRRRFLGGGAVAVLAVGTVAVITRGGDDSIQTADDPAPPTSLVEVAAIDDDATGQGDGDDATLITTPPTLPTSDNVADETVAIPDVGSEIAADSAAYSGVDGGSLVPWGDGFLSVRMEYLDQPLAELPDEVTALFPDEVMELFPDGLPPTINEAIAILNEAGLYDVVSEIVLEHPEAFDAVYAAPTPPPISIVEFTTDGQEWSEVGADLPEMAYGQLSAGHDAIVVWSLDQPGYDDDGYPAPTDSRTLTVARSTDLSSWDVSSTEIPVPVDDRDYVHSEMWVQQVTPTPMGWVAITHSSSWVDEYRILPDDARGLIDTGEWGTTWTEDGIDIMYWGDRGDEPTVETYTWAELGVDPLTEQELYGGGETFGLIVHKNGATTFAGLPPTDDGYLNEIISGADGRLIAVTGNGVFTSTDATNWAPVDGLPGSAWVDGAVPVDGGVLLLSSSAPTPRGWVLADGGGLTEVTLPELPSAYGLWGPGTSAAWIVEAYEQDETVVGPIDPVIFTVERDGIAATISVGPNLTVTAVDTATGDVVFEATAELGEVDTSDFFDEETGDLVMSDADGDEIVRFTNDELEAAYESAAPEYIDGEGDEVYTVGEESDYGPDLWLVATTNGVDWLTIDLADPDMTSSYYWPPAAAVNGDLVLYHDGTGWQTATFGG